MYLILSKDINKLNKTTTKYLIVLQKIWCLTQWEADDTYTSCLLHLTQGCGSKLFQQSYLEDSIYKISYVSDGRFIKYL